MFRYDCDKIENGLERGFVKHRLNYLLKTNPKVLQLQTININQCILLARLGRILELLQASRFTPSVRRYYAPAWVVVYFLSVLQDISLNFGFNGV